MSHQKMIKKKTAFSLNKKTAFSFILKQNLKWPSGFSVNTAAPQLRGAGS